MIVFGNSLSPFVRKVMVFAAEKGVPLEAKSAFPGGDDPAFRAMSPFGKIPAFSDGDYLLCDSSAIVHYIEAKHPSPALIPAEARNRGRAVWFDEFADTILLQPAGKIFFNRIVAKLLGRPADPAAADEAQANELPPVLAWLEMQIPASNFLVGDSLSLADISVGTMLVNLGHAGAAPDAGKYPRLAAYGDSILSRPSFATIVSGERRALGVSD
jgi:glutathione S-transferase